MTRGSACRVCMLFSYSWPRGTGGIDERCRCICARTCACACASPRALVRAAAAAALVCRTSRRTCEAEGGAIPPMPCRAAHRRTQCRPREPCSCAPPPAICIVCGGVWMTPWSSSHFILSLNDVPTLAAISGGRGGTSKRPCARAQAESSCLSLRGGSLLKTPCALSHLSPSRNARRLPGGGASGEASIARCLVYVAPSVAPAVA